MITLSALARSDFDRVANVTVAEHQHKFAGTVREAFETDEDGVDFHGIFEGTDAVGFFKIDRIYGSKYVFCAPGDIGLRAFIIDLAHQGKGFGTAAVKALPEYLPLHYPDVGAIVLTVNFVNPAAYHAYIKGGFADTGQTYPHGDAGPQNVLRMAL